MTINLVINGQTFAAATVRDFHAEFLRMKRGTVTLGLG